MSIWLMAYSKAKIFPLVYLEMNPDVNLDFALDMKSAIENVDFKLQVSLIIVSEWP